MKYKVIVGAWLSGFNFLSCFLYALNNQWVQTVLIGACSVLAMGISIMEYKEIK